MSFCIDDFGPFIVPDFAFRLMCRSASGASCQTSGMLSSNSNEVLANRTRIHSHDAERYSSRALSACVCERGCY